LLHRRRPELGHRLAAVGDREAFTGLHLAKQLRQLGLGLVGADLSFHSNRRVYSPVYCKSGYSPYGASPLIYR
jgi:hypothetical protein